MRFSADYLYLASLTKVYCEYLKTMVISDLSFQAYDLKKS